MDSTTSLVSARAADARNHATIDSLKREMDNLASEFGKEEYLFSPVKIKPAHQAVDLPEVGSFKLPQMAAPLKVPAELGEWLQSIELVLSDKGLESLIDITVPRPPHSHPGALKWQTLSRQVQAWLQQSLTGPMVPHIMARKPRSELADEFLEDIKKAVVRFGIHWDQEALLELVRLKRSKYNNAKEYIGALTLMYRNLWVPIPPHMVIFIMLKELEEDMPTRTEMVLLDLKQRGNYHRLRRADYEKICEFLLAGL